MERRGRAYIKKSILDSSQSTRTRTGTREILGSVAVLAQDGSLGNNDNGATPRGERNKDGSTERARRQSEPTTYSNFFSSSGIRRDWIFWKDLRRG